MLVLAVVVSACSVTAEPSSVTIAPGADQSVAGAAQSSAAASPPAAQSPAASTTPGGFAPGGFDPNSELSEAAQWDLLIETRHGQGGGVGVVTVLEFANVVNGKCLGLYNDAAIADAFELPNLVAAAQSFSDADCGMQQPTFKGNGPTGASTWAEMIDTRFERATTWGTRAEFEDRALQICDFSEREDVEIDPNLSSSARLELAGIGNNDECQLLLKGAGTPPPGRNAVLDELWERCTDEDADACAQLYFDSPADSEYEAYGLTCGGRRQAINCEDVFDDE